MKTAIVILNWNGRRLMETFLPALAASAGENTEIIIADNASTDDSVAWLKLQHPNIKLIINKTNEGFAKGYNTALEQVEAEYFLLLNSDVEVTPSWLEPLTKHLDQNPATAVCQPKILWQRSKAFFEYSGAAGGYIDHYGYPFCRGRVFGNLEKDNGQYDNEAPIFWASGACMLVRSEVFRKVGGFDPLFFAHMEEIDLSWRIRNLGYDIRCIPQSVVYHVGGATLPKHNPGKTFLNFKNNLSMLYKNLPGYRLIPVILIRLILDGIAGIKFLLEGNGGDFLAVIKAHFAFYGRVLSGQLKRTVSRPYIKHNTIYRKSLVWQHYVLRKQKFSDLNFKPGQS